MTGADSSYEFVTMSETSTASDPAQAAQWDLTAQISPHLDLHMMFPLLEYVDSLITAGLVPYTHGDVAASRLALLRPTHMVDYAMDIYRELHGADAAIPQEMEAQKAAVYKQQEELRDGCIKFDELCKNEAEKVRAMWWSGQVWTEVEWRPAHHMHACACFCCRHRHRHRESQCFSASSVLMPLLTAFISILSNFDTKLNF